MSNFHDVWGGFILMVVCCLLGLVLALAGGIVLDQVFQHFDAIGIFDDPDTLAFNGGGWGNLNIVTNMYYFVCFLFPIVGIAAFVKTVIARQGYDQYLGQ